MEDMERTRVMKEHLALRFYDELALKLPGSKVEDHSWVGRAKALTGRFQEQLKGMGGEAAYVQIERGGYTGNDIAKSAKNIPVSPQALRKRINYWSSTDQDFNQLTYLGQRTIPISLDDFILIDRQVSGHR